MLNTLPPYREQEALALTSQLRSQGYDPELIREALTQSQLRERAVKKFGSATAASLLFTRDGLEQATRAPVAALHAERMCAAGASHVLDFGCGIGADSLAFARAGLAVTAIEKDPEAAAAARFNLREFPQAQVIEADGFSLDMAHLGADAIWIDPARRLGGKRLKDPESWIPSLSAAVTLARQFLFGGIKVAPGIDYAALPEHSFTQWVSDCGELVEAVMWLGAAAGKPGREAVMLSPNAAPTTFRCSASDPRTSAEQLEPAPLGTFIVEPDRAIIRAGVIPEFATQHSLAPVAQSIAYLTGSHPAPTALAQNFRVLEVLPLDAAAAGKRLRELGVASVEIKKRGVDISPEVFRKKLKLQRAADTHKQAIPITLIATPLLGKRRLLLAQRCEQSDESA